MERNEIKKEVKIIFVSVLKNNNFEISDELTANDVDGWDSLSHMVIVTEVEKHFDIKFKLKDLNKLNNIGNLIDLVALKTEQKLILPDGL
jgi:acyl carrier protein